MSLFRKPNTNPRPRQDLLDQSQFQGHIVRETFVSEDGAFKVVTFQTEAGEEFKAKGNFYGAGAGYPLRINGAWKDEPRYGWTFVVESYVAIEPATEDAILAYLGSGMLKGVGPTTARRIVAHFGDKTLETLDEMPELLTEVPKIGRKTARRIIDQWEQHRAERETMLFLKKYGLSNAIAIRLLKHYGEQASTILRTNPYRAGLEVSHIGFAKADEIARKMGIAEDASERVQAAFVHLLDQAAGEGHTYLPPDQLLARAADLLGLPTERIQSEIDQAVSNGYIRRADVGKTDAGYFMPSLYACESGVAKVIGELARQARPLLESGVDDRIAHFEGRYRFHLAPQQQDAIRSVAGGGVCVITGGPGTGKTTLVRALLYIMKDSRRSFALCSPTGRAAQRLSETTGQEAATVHRLLKWNAATGRFTHDQKNPLPVDLLIVDEASMLDIPLAFSLLRALPNGATVVFVGDVDQLPSVGPGTFLRDLIESGRARTTRLEVIFRQAEQSLIIANSHRINEGHAPRIPDKATPEADFFFVDRQDPGELIDAMLAMATDRIPKKIGADAVRDIQVLSPMRRGPLGTHELNRLLQERLNPDGQPLPAGVSFRIGDKVIQTSNNYELDVYNGDVGVIGGVHPETRATRIHFGKRAVHYPPDSLDQLELAYAITIHKSQGSEYPAVIVLLHTSHFIMLKRNLLYTAVTRGKKLVVLIGARRALYKAVKTSPEEERLTALREWLLRPPEKDEFL